ncbi:MAG TPA: bacterial transcriptional activator domain-containing protein [Candidatus Saccharimonadales bacterium]|nr:bacterial transcriptional activator domain-containing protein [Candidatus Saccharimonadales bacterium]
MSPLDGVGATPTDRDRRADLEQLKEGAALLAQHGNRVAALAILWAAVAMDPVDQSVHRRLAAALASGGDLEGAAHEYVRYVEFLLPRGELELATAELHYATQTLGRVQKITDAVVRVKAQLPELLERSRQRLEPIAEPTAELHDEINPAVRALTVPAENKLVQLPIAHQTRVVFHTCLHDDGEAAWLQLEGGTDELRPDKVRLMFRDAVLETRRCIPMPAGRKSHARPDGDSKVWVVLRAPEEMLRAIDRDEGDGYRVEALVNGEWLVVDLEDTGCRFGMKRRETRSA